MKIFIVSEAGKIADVTLHTSCKSADESALKVTIKTLMSKIVLDQTSRWREKDECPTSKFYRVMLGCLASCLTTIPQVSSSCTSVYIDGSETRGALNAEVKIKYGTFSGQVESSHASCIVMLENISQMQIVPFTSVQQQ